MTRNDTFFKILFTTELGLIPLTMAIYLLFPNARWIVGLLIAGILIAKIWIELFKNKENRTHMILNAIANALMISSLVIFFTIYDYINVVMCVFVVILAILMNVLKILLLNKPMPEMVDAVDSCYMLFECLTLIAFTFVIFHQLVAKIALFAILLTAGVSILYKLYYLCRTYSVGTKIRNLFRRK